VTFHDHYSSRALAYAHARPTYPPALFRHLASLVPTRGLAWDCGTGSGQAAVGLATCFRRVVATDPSTAQLAESAPHARITFRAALESDSGLARASADLVVAAQAAHWFDLDAFYAEARRVLRPGGVAAVWCYGLCRITPAIDDLFDRFSSKTVGRHWPPERHYVDEGYRTLPFPFPELRFPSVSMEHWWTLREMMAYVETWSAVARYAAQTGTDPVPSLVDAIAPLWGSPDRPRRLRWPLSGRIGRVT
jgi:SAM-dependent methyltransferase